jgi:hypothetical protein
LPGSANLFGGRGATFKNISKNTIQDMKFQEHRTHLKWHVVKIPSVFMGIEDKHHLQEWVIWQVTGALG